jgi:hypothetical protein
MGVWVLSLFGNLVLTRGFRLTELLKRRVTSAEAKKVKE